MRRAEWVREWRQVLPYGDMMRRALGRSRSNYGRMLNAEVRMLRVAEILLRDGMGRGRLAEIARKFYVDRATITRDVKKLREAGFENWSTWEVAERIRRAERRRNRFRETEAARFERQFTYQPDFHPQEPRGSHSYQATYKPPPDDTRERRQREADNYMAQNMEALLDRMLNVPEGFQPTPSEIDLQVARLLGVTPAQADKPKPPSAEAPEHRNPAHTADRASLVDRPNWADYNDRRSQRRGLTAFEDAIPHDDW